MGLTAADPSGRRARELLRAGDLAGLFGLFGVAEVGLTSVLAENPEEKDD